jgi:hypothetical protein
MPSICLLSSTGGFRHNRCSTFGRGARCGAERTRGVRYCSSRPLLYRGDGRQRGGTVPGREGGRGAERVERRLLLLTVPLGKAGKGELPRFMRFVSRSRLIPFTLPRTISLWTRDGSDNLPNPRSFHPPRSADWCSLPVTHPPARGVSHAIKCLVQCAAHGCMPCPSCAALPCAAHWACTRSSTGRTSGDLPASCTVLRATRAHAQAVQATDSLRGNMARRNAPALEAWSQGSPVPCQCDGALLAPASYTPSM